VPFAVSATFTSFSPIHPCRNDTARADWGALSFGPELRTKDKEIAPERWKGAQLNKRMTGH